jgi:hypothetical protein
VDQRALDAIAAWPGLVRDVEGSLLRPVRLDFLELPTVVTAAQESATRLGLSDGAESCGGVAELAVAALGRGCVIPLAGCDYFRSHLLPAGGDSEEGLHGEIQNEDLAVAMRVLQLAQFLGMEILASWCAALIALAVHIARRVSGVEQGGSVEGPAAQAMREILGMPNDWPESCSGELHPFAESTCISGK